jgi:hypothetical protein
MKSAPFFNLIRRSANNLAQQPVKAIWLAPKARGQITSFSISILIFIFLGCVFLGCVLTLL